MGAGQMTIADLSTPALLLDADIFEANIEGMAVAAARAGKNLRPHVKAHKCVEIAKRQIRAGAAGVCVATVEEAELMVSNGIPGVLLTSPVAHPRKCERIADLARTASDLAVVVDHPEQVRMYSDAAERAAILLNVLVDLDVGDHRTGIPPGEPAVEIAKQIAANSNLVFKGLQAYSVRASHLDDPEARADYSSKALSGAQETRYLLISQGIETELISVGSTGSYAADSALPYVTELQAGSYALMDVQYGRIGGVPFGNALTVAAGVISANYPDRVTVDAGFKAFATDRPFGPEIQDFPEARYEWAGDEFGYVFLNQTARRPRLGDRLRFIPPHCDPTVNLYDRIHVCRGNNVEDIWPVMNRWSRRQ
jgi:D-serine deaminase-like pyridoxal phosphate-dependent protein